MTATITENYSLAAGKRRSAQLEDQVTTDASGFRILTGDRPTGPLHLGHYFGTLASRVRLQDAGAEVLVLIADYQVLTDRDTAEHLDENVSGLTLDYLATGIDPARSVIFAHSAVPALNQLLLPFLSLVSVPELERNPTVKDEIAHSRQSSVSGLMFTYPAHQAADILSCKANLVPAGADQMPHVELTRVIARRFNERYGPVFPVPDTLLSSAPLLLGTDGAKMSKSRGNAIAISATADETARLIKGAKTDSIRHISYDPRPGRKFHHWSCSQPCAPAATRTASPTRSAPAERPRSSDASPRRSTSASPLSGPGARNWRQIPVTHGRRCSPATRGPLRWPPPRSPRSGRRCA